MKELLVYVDTSVIGAVCDLEPQSRAIVVQKFIEAVHSGELQIVMSALVLEEIARAPERIRNKLMEALKQLPIEMLSLTQEDSELAEAYLGTGAIPTGSSNDARHIACAAVNGVEVVASWNFKHMANIRVIRAVNSVNVRFGYRTIEILPPEEIIGYEEK